MISGKKVRNYSGALSLADLCSMYGEITVSLALASRSHFMVPCCADPPKD